MEHENPLGRKELLKLTHKLFARVLLWLHIATFESKKKILLKLSHNFCQGSFMDL